MSNKAEEKTMKSAAKRTLKPKLRFPEFRDAGEWEAKELTDLIEVVTPPKKIPTTQYTTTGLYPIIDQSQTYISGWTDDEDAVLSHELPLIIFGDHTCVLKITDAPFAQGADGIKIFHASSGVSTSYLYQHLLFKPVKMEEYKRHFSILKRKIVAFPEEKSGEQQKIASCLSSIDELIAAEAQRLDALKTHKKGLMQQLFPAEGETLPGLRFPEFRDAGEWEEKTLDQIAAYENGKAHENNISDKGQYIVVNSKFISTEGEIRKYSDNAFCIADTGDVLMVLSDVPNGRAIAKCYLVESDNLYTVNQRICKIKPNEIDGKFLFYILDRNPFFLAFDDGVKQTNLRKEDVLNCPLYLPSLPEEQKKISDMVSSLDELITAQTQKLDALKAHKKGLMQQLFPALDEVQG